MDHRFICKVVNYDGFQITKASNLCRYSLEKGLFSVINFRTLSGYSETIFLSSNQRRDVIWEFEQARTFWSKVKLRVIGWTGRYCLKLTARDPFLIRGVMILSLSTGKKIRRGNDLVITSFHKKFIHWIISKWSSLILTGSYIYIVWPSAMIGT